MNSELITQLFEVVLIPLLSILVAYFVKWVNAKSDAIKSETDDATLQKYITLLNNTITNCVISTNQTYVNTLKEQGKFDAEAQNKAFKKTLDAVIVILSDDAKIYLNNALGDLDVYITKCIEAEVNNNKITITTKAE